MKKSQLEQYLDLVPNFPIDGVLFRDISPLLKNHFKETIDEMSALFTRQEWADVDYLVGIESRGFLFASALAYKHGKGVVKARKAGKLPNVHSSQEYGLEYGSDKLEMQIGAGEKVIVLDDLIATGGSMEATAKLCEAVGYEITGFACLIDLISLNNFSYKDITVKSVMQFST